jgi:anti-sigma regulatory factor (Ser/Thr protein kinase)
MLVNRTLTIGDLGSARALLVEWAKGKGLDADTVHGIALSGYEALANSVEHGYHAQGGVVELYADCSDDRVTVTIVDHGTWQPPSGRPDRGRGLVLIRGLCSEATVTSTDTGTTVTMTWLV